MFKRSEENRAASDATADLRVNGAQIAKLIVRQRMILRLFFNNMMQRMHDTALLREQHGKGEQQRIEISA